MNNVSKIAIALLAFGFSACSQAGASSDPNRAEIEKIVKEYLMENPEIIRDALFELDAREERAAFAAVKKDIYEDKRDVAIGPKNAKVTIVEFFDYNCGYCKKSTEWLQGAMEKHPDDIRVIFKELPILDGRTKTSKNAAKAALAAHRQGKYLDMHFALMAERGLSAERVEKIAEKTGLSMTKFKKDMKDPALETQIEDAMLLARRVPSFSGTPYFMINDDYIAGANTERLQQMLDDALKSKG
jgi:protein-disulfide isomerase